MKLDELACCLDGLQHLGKEQVFGKGDGILHLQDEGVGSECYEDLKTESRSFDLGHLLRECGKEFVEMVEKVGD